jgi:hypothetical protein
MNFESRGFLPIVPVALLALTLMASPCVAAEFAYASTTATQSYGAFIGPVPIAGLTITLPAASASFNTAVITLNMPNLFLSQPTAANVMAATLQIVAPASSAGPVVATGEIGCDNADILTSGPKPFTIVAKVPLSGVLQIVEAEWFSNPPATGIVTVTTQTFASLSAIMVRE